MRLGLGGAADDDAGLRRRVVKQVRPETGHTVDEVGFRRNLKPVLLAPGGVALIAAGFRQRSLGLNEKGSGGFAEGILAAQLSFVNPVYAMMHGVTVLRLLKPSNALEPTPTAP